MGQRKRKMPRLEVGAWLAKRKIDVFELVILGVGLYLFLTAVVSPPLGLQWVADRLFGDMEEKLRVPFTKFLAINAGLLLGAGFVFRRYLGAKLAPVVESIDRGLKYGELLEPAIIVPTFMEYAREIGRKVREGDEGKVWAGALNRYFNSERAFLRSNILLTDLDGYAEVLTEVLSTYRGGADIFALDFASLYPKYWFEPNLMMQDLKEKGLKQVDPLMEVLESKFQFSMSRLRDFVRDWVESGGQMARVVHLEDPQEVRFDKLFQQAQYWHEYRKLHSSEKLALYFVRSELDEVGDKDILRLLSFKIDQIELGVNIRRNWGTDFMLIGRAEDRVETWQQIEENVRFETLVHSNFAPFGKLEVIVSVHCSEQLAEIARVQLRRLLPRAKEIFNITPPAAT